MNIDPADAAIIGGAALLMKEPVNRFVGPTADYLGSLMHLATKRQVKNVRRVLDAAIRKAGTQVDSPCGPNPRVLHGVVNEAAFNEDPLIAEYLGGILASSRSEDGRDDRGVAYVATVRSLSTYQLRTHYLLYSAMLRKGLPRDVSNSSYWCQEGGLTVFFREQEYYNAMQFIPGEDLVGITTESMTGLRVHGLVEQGRYSMAPEDNTSPIKYFWPTMYGFNLYAWANGQHCPDSGNWFDMPAPAPILGCEFDAICIDFGEKYSPDKEIRDSE